MPRNRGTKAGFCESLEWGIPIEWFDLTGMHRLDEDRRVKVQLRTRGHADHYPGFMVTVLNKREGEIDRKFFKFDDYLDRDARTDARRNDYPGNRTCLCFHVASSCGWEFYIAKPASTRPFCEAVEAYVGMFR